jgi:hypothetical protein
MEIERHAGIFIILFFIRKIHDSILDTKSENHMIISFREIVQQYLK